MYEIFQTYSRDRTQVYQYDRLKSLSVFQHSIVSLNAGLTSPFFRAPAKARGRNQWNREASPVMSAAQCLFKVSFDFKTLSPFSCEHQLWFQP